MTITLSFGPIFTQVRVKFHDFWICPVKTKTKSGVGKDEQGSRMPGEEAEGSFVGTDGVVLSLRGIVKIWGVCPGCAPGGGPLAQAVRGSIPPRNIARRFPRPPHDPAPAVCPRGVLPTPGAPAHRAHGTECLSVTRTHVPMCVHAYWPHLLTSVMLLPRLLLVLSWFARLYNRGRTLSASQFNTFSWCVSGPHTFLTMSV